MTTRRSFVVSAVGATLSMHRPRPWRAPVTLTLPDRATGPTMPDDFVGLSFESEQLADSTFLSPKNHELVDRFKDLTPHGVLRLGGNTAEYSYWKPTPESPEPPHPPTREVSGEPRAQFYPVTSAAVRNLSSFLDATGWSCIYGINLGTNTPERAAAEAAFVAKMLGTRLQYFQMGNEPDLFASHLRDPESWSEEAYLTEWLAMARAIVARVPAAKFGLPDIGGDSRWIPEIAAAWPSIDHPPDLAAITHHYYYDGPATNPVVTIPNILKASTMVAVQRTADHVNAAARTLHASVRMSEGNTCYGGGKPGVSDVFAAALWSADYALLLAKNGYAGINLHGGAGKSVANSLGGELSGDLLLRREGASAVEMAAHPRPFYTPIGESASGYTIEPVGRGLQFAGAFRGGTFFDVDLTPLFQASGVNATAYAVERGGERSVVVLNKDIAQAVDVVIDFGRRTKGRLDVARLLAPAIDAREARIERERPIALVDGRISLSVPAGSGVMIGAGRMTES